MGGNAAFLEVGACGRSRARWDPASVRNGPKSITPPPHPPPSIPTRKGTDCGESSKKERFDPKAALTGGLCLTGAAVVALNRRILRGKKGKKRKKQNKQKKGALGVWQQGIFAQSKTAGNCPKTEAAWTPDEKRQREPGSKTAPKTCRKGSSDHRYLCCFSPKTETGGGGF